MDRLQYAGGEYFTSTEVARALVRYAAALGERQRAGTAEIPIRHSDGTLGTLAVLVGPASQLTVETVESDLEEVAGEAARDAILRALEDIESGDGPSSTVDPEPYPDPRVPHPDWIDEL